LSPTTEGFGWRHCLPDKGKAFWAEAIPVERGSKFGGYSVELLPKINLYIEINSMSKSTELSTVNLAAWPSPKAFKRLSQTLTVLARCQNDLEMYGFRNSSDGLQIAHMHNGQGDEAEIIFTSEGALFRGFSHEAPLASWYTESKNAYPGTFKNFPDTLKDLKKEYLNDEDISFVA
jgi:hypothetical protein